MFKKNVFRIFGNVHSGRPFNLGVKLLLSLDGTWTMMHFRVWTAEAYWLKFWAASWRNLRKHLSGIGLFMLIYIYIYSCRCLHKGSIPLRYILIFTLDKVHSLSQSVIISLKTEMRQGSGSIQIPSETCT